MSMPDSTPGSAGSFFAGFRPPSPEELDAALGEAYRVEKMLGQGGMGAVYQATEVKMNRPVAIKVLPAEIAQLTSGSGFDFAERFEREAQAMARLNHPNIIQVYEFGETADGLRFFTMEYVEGSDLHELIRGGQLTEEHAFSWITQLCDALSYAHAQGMVHRDIKPANVMIDSEGRVKVADFGLVKVTGSESLQSLNTNVAIGTPEFTAPEIIENDGQADHRADIYSLGVLMYQMLTRKLPRGVWQPPSIRNPNLDRRLDPVIEKALHSDPDARYQTVELVEKDLTHIALNEATLEELKSEPHLKGEAGTKVNEAAEWQKQLAEQQAKRRKILTVVLAGVSLLALGGVGAMFLLPKRNEPNPESIAESQGAPTESPTAPVATSEPKPGNAEPEPEIAESPANPEQPMKIAKLETPSTPEPEPPAPEPPPTEPQFPRLPDPPDETRAAAQIQADLTKLLAEFDQNLAIPDSALPAKYLAKLEQVNFPPNLLTQERERVRWGELGTAGADTPLGKAQKLYRDQNLERTRLEQVVPILEETASNLTDLAKTQVAAGVIAPTAAIGAEREKLQVRLEAARAAMEKLAARKTENAKEETKTAVLDKPLPIPELVFPPKRPERRGELIRWYASNGKILEIPDFGSNIVAVQPQGTTFIDAEGRLGFTDDTIAANFRADLPKNGYVQVLAGEDWLYALFEDGSVRAFGPSAREIPREGQSNVAKLAFLESSVVAIRKNGDLAPPEGISDRQAISALRQVVDYAASHSDFGVALKRGGRIELVDPRSKITDKDTLRAISRLRDAVAVDCYGFSSLVLRANGEVFAFGWPLNHYPTGSPIPPDVPKDIDAIRVGRAGQLSPDVFAAIHSRSRGWLFFGKGFTDPEVPKKLNANARGCFELGLLDNYSHALRDPNFAPDPADSPQTAVATTPGRTIFVSPKGGGLTVTLDQALAQAKEGDTLWLAPGEYPKSTVADPNAVDLREHYIILQEGLVVRGHRSMIPSEFRVRAYNVAISGVRLRGVTGLNGLRVSESIVQVFNSSPTNTWSLSNSVVRNLKSWAKQSAQVQNCTIVSASSNHQLRGALELSRNVIVTQQHPFALYETDRIRLSNSLVGSTDPFGKLEDGPNQGFVLDPAKPADFESKAGIKLENVRFEPVQFENAEAGDFRLKPGSPGYDEGWGAKLDADGWPVAE